MARARLLVRLGKANLDVIHLRYLPWLVNKRRRDELRAETFTSHLGILLHKSGCTLDILYFGPSNAFTQHGSETTNMRDRRLQPDMVGPGPITLL